MKHKIGNTELFATLNFIGKCLKRLLQRAWFRAAQIDEVGIVRNRCLDAVFLEAFAEVWQPLAGTMAWHATASGSA